MEWESAQKLPIMQNNKKNPTRLLNAKLYALTFEERFNLPHQKINYPRSFPPFSLYECPYPNKLRLFTPPAVPDYSSKVCAAVSSLGSKGTFKPDGGGGG